MMTILCLPDQPNEWGPKHPEGYRQRWLPGAFGDLTTLEGVEMFQVVRESFEEDENGVGWRTIEKAEVVA